MSLMFEYFANPDLLYFLSPKWAVYCEEHHARDNENNLCLL